MHATSIHRLSIVYVHVSNVLFIFFSGALIGFADLGEVNTHLSAFERMLESDRSCTKQPLAKSMLLMVRGLFSGLQFPYACGSLKGDQMFHIFWKAVGRLERYGFRVLDV